MRIISGSSRGLKLVSPEGTDTRPTLDRVKEAVFSMLLPYIYDSVVLDLFAGSGAMGIEALSRGAKMAVFVDCSEDAAKCIKTNVNNARMGDKASVILSDSCDYLRDTKEKFDIVFIDPPYTADLYNRSLELIAEHNILNQDAIIVVEWDYESGFDSLCPAFEIIKEKKYGRVGISVLKRRNFE